ncbi:MAG: FmdB family transcriptional regulator [Pseudonocardiales bacterium]|nr:FmdB family transcriptional regulator [Pseudonocardiales bacterium]
MPTYSYACTTCEHRFDTVQAFSDSSLTDCPECTGRLRKLFSSVGIVFKGSGFYRTDSRSDPVESSGEGKKEPKPDSSKSDPAKSDPAKSDSTRSDSTQSDSRKSDRTQSDRTQSGPAKSGSAKSGSAKSGSASSRSSSGSSSTSRTPSAAAS